MSEGFVLMIVGMGTVFVILSLLVGLMQISANFFASWPEDEVSPQQKIVEEDDELELIAIALAAIERG